MVLQRYLLVRLLDIHRVGIPRHAKDLVIVAFLRHERSYGKRIERERGKRVGAGGKETSHPLVSRRWPVG